MSQDLQQEQTMTLEEKLEEVAATQRRICFELDIVMRGLYIALEKLGCKPAADKLMFEFEEVRIERREADYDRDTVPPKRDSKS